MESNVEDNTTPAAEEAAAPPRRRASRRVSAAAGAAAPESARAAEAPAAEAPAAEASAAPAADAAQAAAQAPAADEAPAAAAPKKRATRSRKKVEAAADEASGDAASAPADAGSTESDEQPVAAPKKRATRSRKKVETPAEPASDAASEAPVAAEAASAAAPAQSSDSTAAAAEPEAPAKRTRSRRATSASAASKADDASAAAPEAAATDAAQPEAPAGAASDATRSARNSEQSERGEQEQSERSERSEQERGEKSERGEKMERGDRSDRAEKSENGDGERSGRGRRGRGRNQKNESADANEQAEATEDEGKQRGQNGSGAQNAQKNGEAKNGENSSRSSRTRQRDRKRRGQGDDIEPEITEDDVLLPIAGILDVLDNYAFVRTSGYLPGTSDVYVSLGQVKKYGLRRGDAVVGAIRQPRDNDGASRQKYNAIVKIDTVNGRPVDEQAEERVDIADLTATYPEERLRFETDQKHVLGRAVDLVAPTGLGQRTALVVPAHLDGSAVLGELAEAVSANRPDAHLMLLLANAQPEEITRLQRSVRGEVVAASFDRAAEDQAIIAELAIDRAKRLVELGHDVVVLVDSLNRFARAYAQAQHAQTRPALDEIDELALAQIKRLLASARNVENGGSLTVIATVQSKTGVAADKLLLREVLAVVNSEVRFAKTAPGLPAAVDFEASRTRNPESMLGADEVAALATLRAALHEDDADDRLRERLRSTATNAALLAEVQRSGSLS
ncbi:transcription termination factor Rho [Leucobacter chromiiresistens]|uniref:Rho RNA-BD domain-containing protein n=1 Tax=Leucobacter chromiiresistens TaxID=1079994 RepID=A0A147ERS7_9MICO|nr:transcription termination factor Rho [Leucobacter chromiiresistens]KTR87142.1 hypothetical protein NS354_01200 [Leucobacter chromiiresistens]